MKIDGVFQGQSLADPISGEALKVFAAQIPDDAVVSLRGSELTAEWKP